MLPGRAGRGADAASVAATRSRPGALCVLASHPPGTPRQRVLVLLGALGRDGELATLLGFLEAPLPSALVLEGEAGIGKTTLFDAGLAAARQRGFAVISCRPAESEIQLAFAGLSDLLGPVLDDFLPGLPGPQRRAIRVALLLEESSGPPPDQRAVAAATLGALRLLARERRLLVAVDDAQWLDPSSAAAVGFAARRLGDASVALLVATRAAQDATRLGLERAGETGLERIRLGPLGSAAVQELVSGRGGVVLPRPLLRQVHEASGGNPFYALELAGFLGRRGIRHATAEALPIPETLQELVRDRLAGLSGRARELLPAAAALPNATLATLQAVVGSGAREGVAEAVEARVLERDGDRVVFVHPLIAASVYASLDAESRREVHGCLARVVADPEERATHLALATAQPDREVADALEQAAAAAERRGGFAAAAGLAERAWRLTPEGDRQGRQRRCIQAARLYFEAGDAARATELLDGLLAGAELGIERARVLFELARVRGKTEGVELGGRLAAEALSECGPDDLLGAEIHAFLGEYLRMARDGDSALPHARAAVELAERVGDRRLLAHALAVLGLLEFNAGSAAAGAPIERALALEAELDEPGIGPARWSRAHQLFWSGRLDDARSWLATMVDDCFRLDLPEHDALWYLCQVEFRSGDWERAWTLAEASLAVSEQLGLEGLEPIELVPLATVAAHRGDVEQAQAYAERGLELAERSGHRPTLVLHRSVLGFLALSLGDPGGAATELARAAEILQTLGIREPNMFTTLPDRSEALAALGEPEHAELVLEPWHERARALDRAWSLAIAGRCRGVVAAARGDVEGALHAFGEALREHRRAGDPFQLARTLVALGSTQRRARRRRAARDSLEQALREFEQLGARLWAERARDELRRIGGRPPAARGLTPSEERVAELVARGLTNNEVAAALFLSVKTVESNLRTIYRKLGVRSRTELARRLLARESLERSRVKDP